MEAPVRITFDSRSSPNRALIETDDLEGLASIQGLLRDLARANLPRTISIRRLPGVVLSGLEDFELELVETAGRTKPTIQAVRSETGSLIHWVGDRDDWDYRAILMEGLMSSPTPGHQFLNGYESLDPIEVEVSFRER